MKRIVISLAIFALFIFDAIPAPVDFAFESETAAIALQHFYNKKGLWDGVDWWNAANCVEALENVASLDNGRNYLDVLAKTFKSNSRTNYLNEYYDDEGWWALAWIHAYDLTGKPKYLKAAKIIFKDLTHGWTEHCEGGLIWRKKYAYKNAIPNELFLLVAIRLHERTPDDDGPGSYFDWAIREWNWFKSTGMINQQNLVNDGLDRYCENDGKTTWTYNQGVILGGLTDLYKVTGDTNYLVQVTAIADAAIATLVDENGVLQEPCEDKDCPGGDTPQFKGIFIRYLAYLYDETHDPTYLKFLQKNARAVWDNDRDDENNLGLKWDGPFDFADATRQSSAMMAVSALAEPVTQSLPFCKGAGGVAFSHAVGAATGTLAWTCNTNNTSIAGLMLSGACGSLAAGKHVAHFRMAVEVITNCAQKLARLQVVESATGKMLAVREIGRPDFNARNATQDFSLVFTNAFADAPIFIQVYWLRPAAAQELTLTDVSLDGYYNWAAANVDHDIGRLDGLNGWEADPIRDHASGYLVKGPGTTGFISGEYSVEFELKVDNFNLNKAPVARLLVIDADTKEEVAAREVSRNQFPDGMYHVFSLEFKAKPARRYDFRTYWHFTPQAPRLTQRSIVVQPINDD